jgi:predicted dehydrogenase
MTAPLQIGLIGAGGIGSTYAELFAHIADGRLAVVCDVDADKGVPLARAAAAAYADDYRLLDDLDAVIVATPPVTHPEIAIHFLRAGIPVLCEKPLAIDVSSAERMVRESRRTGALLTIASKFRYVPDITTAQTMIKSGMIGDIILYENTFASHVDMSGRWNAIAAVSGGGVLIDNGTHSLDIARYLLGPIEQVLAVEGKRVQCVDVEDTARVFFTTTEGVTGTIDLSWSVSKERDSFIEIYGSEGNIRIGWKSSAYRLHSVQEWVEFGHGYNKLEAMTAQVDNFLGGVRGTQPMLIQAEDGVASVAVVEAAYASLNSPHWIAVQGGTELDRVVA